MNNFQTRIADSYDFSGEFVFLGVPTLGDQTFSDLPVGIPYATLNRHGLVSGATGTGKTKTIQKLLEGLSQAGIPSVMMDMKGDISGLAMPGLSGEKILERSEKTGESTWKPEGFPVEFFSLLGEGGAQMRVTVSEFGPSLFGRLFDLSDAQMGALAIVFRYCDDRGLLLVDLQDLKTTLQFLASDEGKTEIATEYGTIAPATLQVLIRKILELEAQGGKNLFGERSLELSDLVQVDDSGKGQINIVRLMQSMRQPLIFSSFMLSLLTEIYTLFPEVGDLPKPRLVLVLDEAHAFFADAPKNFVSDMELMIKLIRSKGVSVIFCTQNPIDIPESILGQLGFKVQHALRAFTPKDQESIRKAARNFPTTEDYSVESEILSLGIGEALFTALSLSGRPTPLVRILVAPPRSRMDTLTDAELDGFLSVSPLMGKYHETLDPESAHEFLIKKIQAYLEQKHAEKREKEKKKNPTLMDTIAKTTTRTIGTELGKTIGKNIGGRRGETIGGQIARSILGSIFK